MTRLCLAKAHTGWRSADEARAFARGRDASRRGALGWLVEHCAHVADWVKLESRLRELVQPQHGGAAAAELVPEALFGPDALGAEQSLALARECEARAWRGPWIALAARAAALAPADPEPILSQAAAAASTGSSDLHPSPPPPTPPHLAVVSRADPPHPLL